MLATSLLEFGQGTILPSCRCLNDDAIIQVSADNEDRMHEHFREGQKGRPQSKLIDEIKTPFAGRLKVAT